MGFVVVVFVLFVGLFAVASGRHVLFIGDSLDRGAVEEWCHYLGQTMQVWRTPPVISYIYNEIKSFTSCESPEHNITLSFLRVYGTSKAGPYYGDAFWRRIMRFLNTEIIIQTCLDFYLYTYGIPDLILFHTANWDAHAYLTNAQLQKVWQNTSAPLLQLTAGAKKFYELNMIDRLDTIHSTVHKVCLAHNITTCNQTVQYALRSMVYWPITPSYGSYVEAQSTPAPIPPDSIILATNPKAVCFENRMSLHFREIAAVDRAIAINRSMSFYDFDSDVWSVYNHNYGYCHDVLQDRVHPANPFFAAYAEKVLGLRYSRDWQLPPSHATGTNYYWPPLLIDQPTVGTEGKDDSKGYYILENNRTIFRRIVLVQDPSSRANSSNSSGGGDGLYFVSYRISPLLHSHNNQNHLHHSGNSSRSQGSRLMVEVYRHTGFNADMMKALRLGPADIYHPTSIDEWQRFTLSPEPFPSWIRQAVVLIPAAAQKTGSVPAVLVHCPASHDLIIHRTVEWWLIENNERLSLPFVPDKSDLSQMLSVFNATSFVDGSSSSSKGDSNKGSSSSCWSHLDLFPLGRSLPDIYRDNRLMQVAGDPSIYVFMNGTRRYVTGVAVMLKHGWEWGQVITVVQRYARDVNRIPVGPPLTD